MTIHTPAEGKPLIKNSPTIYSVMLLGQFLPSKCCQNASIWPSSGLPELIWRRFNPFFTKVFSQMYLCQRNEQSDLLTAAEEEKGCIITGSFWGAGTLASFCHFLRPESHNFSNLIFLLILAVQLAVS